MSSLNSQLKLFSVYPFGSTNASQRGQLNANSVFTIPATAFTPAYVVNNPNASVAAANTSYTVNPDYTLSRSTGSASAASTNYQLNGNGQVTTASSSPNIPNIPPQYQARLNSYELSDANYNSLVSGSSFVIPLKDGFGLQVTPDGMGGIASVTVVPNAQSLVTESISDYPLPNRTEITSGAVFKIDIDPGLGGSATADATAGSLPVPASPVANSGTASLNTNPFLSGVNGASFNANGVAGIGLGGPFALASGNPVAQALQQRLAQLQPPSQGATVVGANAQFSAEQSRQLATSQAGLDVSLDASTRQNIADLSSASRPQENYASIFQNPVPIDRLMDGRIPVAAGMPGSLSTTGSRSAVSDTLDLTMNSDGMDAKSRRGPGGYLSALLLAQHRSEPSASQFNEQQSTGLWGNRPGYPSDSMDFNSQSGTGFGDSENSGQAQQNMQRRRPFGMTA